MSQAQKIKEFYNQNFFIDGETKEAHLIISFESNGEKIIIPGVKVHPSTTIDSIFKAYHSYLNQKTNPVIDEMQSSEENKDSIIDFEQIEHNNNTYLIEQVAEDNFIIRNKETDKIISDKSPLHRTIVKKFNAR